MPDQNVARPLPKHAPSAFHWLKLAASSALLGAVLAGIATLIPPVELAAAGIAIDAHVVGALVGLVASVPYIAHAAGR